MKKILICASILAASVLSFGYANATEARDAITMCEKNPKCRFAVQDNGSVEITVNGNQIDCPQVGQCVCTICAPPARIGPGKQRNLGKVARSLAISK